MRMALFIAVLLFSSSAQADQACEQRDPSGRGISPASVHGNVARALGKGAKGGSPSHGTGSREIPAGVSR